MIRLAAIISLALSFIFKLWSISHGGWDWALMMVLGLLLWCIADHPRVNW